MLKGEKRHYNLLVGWKSDINDSSMLSESFANHILVGSERKVTEEERIRWRILGVAEFLSTFVGAFLRGVVVARSGEVNVGLTTVNHGAFLGLESSGAVGGFVEVNISKALGATALLVCDDTSARNLSKFLELTVEPLIIDVPAQVANKQVCGSVLSNSLNLGFLCGGDGLFFGLTLLRRRFVLIFTRVVGAGLFLIAAGRRV